jgi:hypothetical protein
MTEVVNSMSSWEELDKDFLAAAREGNVKEVRDLLERGAYVNYQNQEGWTALMYSAESQNVEMAQLLMDNGADNELRNKEGNKAIWIAKTGPVQGVIFNGLKKRIEARQAAKMMTISSKDVEM